MTAGLSRQRVARSVGFMVVMLMATMGAASAPRPSSFRATAARVTALATAGSPFSRQPVSVSFPGRALPVSDSTRLRRSPRRFALVRSAPPAAAAESLGREVKGTVRAAGTDMPLGGVEVRTIGVQLIGAPNYTCTNEGGDFRLRVPLGDVRLEAAHPDYQFSLKDLRPTDSTANFTGPRVVRDTARLVTGRSILMFQGPTKLGPASEPTNIVDGRVISELVSGMGMGGGELRCAR